jgi:LytS/YehU family sensor histidine kinase
VAAIQGPGTIRISVTGDGPVARIELYNSSDGPGGAGHGHGIGIDNSRRRLQLHYGDRAAIEHGPVADGYRVAIDLPTALERGKVA